MDGPSTPPPFPPPSPGHTWDTPTMPEGFLATDQTADRTRRDGDADPQLLIDAGVLWETTPTVERMWRLARRNAIALGLAACAAAAAFFVVSIIDFVAGDRTFGDQQRRFLLRFWYLFPVFAAVASPVTFTLLWRGRTKMMQLVTGRGYWKVLVAGFVALPVAIAIVIFVATNVIMILLAIVVLIAVFVILGHLGAF